jgi:hypothetical protein
MLPPGAVISWYFSPRQGIDDDVAALDQPDVGLVGAAADLVAGKYLKQLGVKRALVEEERKPSGSTLLRSVAAAHFASMLFLARDLYPLLKFGKVQDLSRVRGTAGPQL